MIQVYVEEGLLRSKDDRGKEETLGIQIYQSTQLPIPLPTKIVTQFPKNTKPHLNITTEKVSSPYSFFINQSTCNEDG